MPRWLRRRARGAGQRAVPEDNGCSRRPGSPVSTLLTFFCVPAADLQIVLADEVRELAEVGLDVGAGRQMS